jgi:hypothetical protein
LKKIQWRWVWGKTGAMIPAAKSEAEKRAFNQEN